MSRSTGPLFLLVAALWGLPYALIGVALDHGAGPFFIAWARVVIGAVILLGLAGARGELGGLRRHPIALVAVAVSDIAVPFCALTVGEQHLSSSLASILIATTPLFVGAMTVAFLPAERPSPRTWAGLAVGFGGVTALFGGGLEGSMAGALLVLLAGASYAAASLLVRAKLAGVTPLAASTWALTVAAVVLAPAALIEPAGRADAHAWAAIGALGVLCTAAAFALYYRLIARAGATSAALTTYVSPLFALAIGAVVLAEEIEPNAIAGFALILAGAWLVR